MINLAKYKYRTSLNLVFVALSGIILLTIVAMWIMFDSVIADQTIFILFLSGVFLLGGFFFYLLWGGVFSDKLSKGRKALMEDLETGQTIALIVESKPGELIYCNELFKQWFPHYKDGVAKAFARGFGDAMPDTFDDIDKMSREAFAGHGQRREVSSSLAVGADWYEITVHKMVSNNLAWQVRDISFRKRQFERAGDRLALLSRALDRAPFGIVIADGDLMVKEANTAFRRFVKGKDVVDRNFITMIDADNRMQVEENLTNVLNGSKTGDSIDVILDGNDAFTVSIHATLATLTRSGDSGLLLHIEDMTERKRLEMQFAQSQKMQAVGQLAGGVAHDFNNMLTAIIGFCDLLLQRHQPGNPSFSDTMQIKQNANRAAGLVRQLLAFSRQQTLTPRVFNLSDVLAELSVLLRRLIGDKIEMPGWRW